MTHRIHNHICAALLCCLLIGGLSGDVLADSLQPRITEDERTVFRLLQGEEHASKLRALVAKIQETDSESFVAELVLGVVAYQASDFPLALFHLNNTRQRLLKKDAVGTAVPADGDPVHWHSFTLYWFARTLMAMARYEDQAEALHTYISLDYDRHEELNGFPVPAKRLLTTALVLCRRYPEAQALVDNAMKRKESMTAADYMSVRSQLILVQRYTSKDPGAVYVMYEDLLREYQDRNLEPGAGDFARAAQFADMEGHYARAGELLEKCMGDQNNSWSILHPYRSLTQLFVLQADWMAARKSLKNCWEWHRTRMATVRQEMEKETRLELALYYLATGYSDRCWYVVNKWLLRDPARSGFRFTDQKQWESGVTLTAISALKQNMMLDAERNCESGLKGWLSLRAGGVVARFRLAELRRKFTALLLVQLKNDTPRLTTFDLALAPRWMWGEAVSVLGPAISSKLFRDYPLGGSQKRMFQSMVDAEIAYRAGHWRRVSELAKRARSEIPEQERILHARMAALQGVAFQREGKNREALVALEDAYRLHPPVFRFVDIRLPLVIQEDGNTLSGECARALKRSPRFLLVVQDGLILSLATSGKDMACTLSGPSGEVMWRGQIEIPSESMKGVSVPTYLVGELHSHLFSAGKRLESNEYYALEGMAVRGPEEAPDAIDMSLRQSR